MSYSVERISPTMLRFHVTMGAKAASAASSPKEDACDNGAILDEEIKKVLLQEGILPLSPVRILPAENKRQNDTFCFETETLPEITLPNDLSSIRLSVEEPLPDPREFQHAVMELRRSRAKLHTVEEKRMPCDGDVLQLDIFATARGKEVPGMSRRSFTMLLHPMAAMSEAEAALRSMFAGETRVIKTLCPETYPDKELRGTDVELSMHLKRICTEELPEFNNALAKEMGFSSLEKLKSHIFNRIMGEKIQNIQSRAQKRLVDMLLENQTFPLPSALTAIHRQDCLQELRAEFRSIGKTEEEITAALESMEEEINRQTAYRTRVQALLLALASREHMEISQEEIDSQIRKIAERSHKEYEKLHNAVWKSSLSHELQLRLLAAKAMRFLYKNVNKVVVDCKGNPVPVQEAQTRG